MPTTAASRSGIGRPGPSAARLVGEVDADRQRPGPRRRPPPGRGRPAGRRRTAGRPGGRGCRSDSGSTRPASQRDAGGRLAPRGACVTDRPVTCRAGPRTAGRSNRSPGPWAGPSASSPDVLAQLTRSSHLSQVFVAAPSAGVSHVHRRVADQELAVRPEDQHLRGRVLGTSRSAILVLILPALEVHQHRLGAEVDRPALGLVLLVAACHLDPAGQLAEDVGLLPGRPQRQLDELPPADVLARGRRASRPPPRCRSARSCCRCRRCGSAASRSGPGRPPAGRPAPGALPRVPDHRFPVVCFAELSSSCTYSSTS